MNHRVASLAVALAFFAAMGANAAPFKPGERYSAPADAGRDLIGTTPPEWQGIDWLAPEPLSLKSLHGKVVIVRWWTAPGCPYCSASAGTLNDLWKEHRDDGLMVIGMYHHKASGPLTREHVAEHAKRFGFEFPIGIDPEWKNLRRWWLDGRERAWTSVTFVLGRDGRIRHLHGGGAYFPGEPGHEALVKSVREALAEKR